MVYALKCFNYKAVKEVSFEGLGQINILCGKNNSGKTSIFEALSTESSFAVGEKFDNVIELRDLLEPICLKYSDPSPSDIRSWFYAILFEEQQAQNIWYDNDNNKIIEVMNRKLRSGQQQSFLEAARKGIQQVLQQYLGNIRNTYKQMVVPSKRLTSAHIDINTKQEVENSGLGIINKLFFLKNQHEKSKDFRVYRVISENFYRITRFHFNIFPNTRGQLELMYLSEFKKWIRADASGQGLSEILVMVTLTILSDANFIFIEEPENHLHAEYIKRLLAFFRNVKDKQFFLSTHSPVIINSTFCDRIYFCQIDGELKVSDQTSLSKVISSLGFDPYANISSDAIILTEGLTDIPVIKKILEYIGVESSYNIKYWPLGGDIMGELDLSMFEDRDNIYAVIDNDHGSKNSRIKFASNAEHFNIKYHKLKRYSIENYFSVNAVNKVFPSIQLAEIKPNISILKQFPAESNFNKTKNGEIINQMTLEEFTGTDLLAFLQKMKDDLEIKRKLKEEKRVITEEET